MSPAHTLAAAQARDARDPLAGFRARFALPRDERAEPLVYLCGHSLGLLPLAARELVNEELEEWARLAVQAHEHEITTVEGLAPNDHELSPLQEAFRDNHGLQCGFCTPGMLTTLVEFLRDNPAPTEAEVRIAISGNLCRCTGYPNIVAAALDAAKRLQGRRSQ